MRSYLRLAHIAIYTPDIERSIKFYETLGAECTMRDSVQKPTGVNQLAMLTLINFEIELIQPGDGKMPAGEGVIPHFAVEVANLPLVVNEMRVMGLGEFCTEEPIELPNLFGGLRNIFFKGPSGEMVELIEHFNESTRSKRL